MAASRTPEKTDLFLDVRVPPTIPINEARREIQQLLLARGYDIGTVDGMVGDKTRQAIQEEQRKRGLPVDDGRPGQRILKALRQSP